MRLFLPALAVLLSAGAAGAAPPKNVLVLIADDLGREVGCYGDPVARTPNIDALARSGTRFDLAFASVASCSPSRASMLTGLPTHQSGQFGLAHAEHSGRTYPTVQSLPGLLGKAGYVSTSVGKLHVTPMEAYPFTAVVGGNGRNPVMMAELSRKAIADAGDKPFFLWVGFIDPHRAQKGFANDAKYPADVVREVFDPAKVPVPPFLSDTPTVRADLADYYQSAARLDDGVGRVLKALDESGKANDTLVIFLSDNGMPFPAAKTNLYDPSLRLPLIVRKPGQKPGVVSPAMASFTDLAPTVLEWAGVAAPKAMAGQSLLPLLDGATPDGWDAVYGSHQWHEVTMYYPMRMVRTRTHKLIVNLAHDLEYPAAGDLWGSPTWQEILREKPSRLGARSLEAYLHRPKVELYDLRDDPDEARNRADDPEQASARKELEARLLAWRKATRDPWLILDREPKGEK